MNSKTGNELQGKIVEWDRSKGFGYVRSGKKKLFLHHRDFCEQHKRPDVGDKISFEIGSDPKGRTCATNAFHLNDGGRITILSLLVTLGLLVLPAFALHRSGINPLWAIGYIFGISGITYLAYASDKRRARAKQWRVSEAQLHLMEMVGGWPGAFLAQRNLRHKCSKGNYQLVFWTIILAHQFAAFDSLQNWQLTRSVSGRLSAQAKSMR